uniref:Secreted protein n=1 Tax=Glossina palpalis gambiensis TaxID=67801 RepID=A0A1B0BHI9_9MUSC
MPTLLLTFLLVDASTSTKRHVVVAVFVAADAVSAADQIPDDGDDGMPNRDQKVFEFAHEDNQRVIRAQYVFHLTCDQLSSKLTSKHFQRSHSTFHLNGSRIDLI